MRSRRASVIVAGALALGVAAATPNAAVGQAPPDTNDQVGRYIVVLEAPDVRAPAVERHAEAFDVEPTHVYSNAIDGYSAELTDDQVAELEDDERVAYVTEDTAWELLDQSVPTGVRRAFGPDNPATGIGAPTDRRVDADVAVIDSGVNAHDDLHVFDRVDCLVPGGCEPGGFDDHGHGTHVAGTVAAVNNTQGVVGTAPGARIWSLKVCGGFGNGCPGSAIVAAVDYVTAHADTIDVANVSLGGTAPNPAVAAAITASVDAGVVYAVAAGNDNVDAATFQPANHPDVITVSALEDTNGLPDGGADPLAGFSNWGATVEVAAPGVAITSLSRDGHGLRTMSGTSMATPHVTGSAALLASADKPTNRAEALAVRQAIVDAGNLAYSSSNRGPGDYQEPLLDLHDPARFAPTLVAPRDWDPAAAVPGGTTQFADAQCAQDRDGSYKFGGATLDGGTAVASSWRYDHGTDTWDELAPYPGGPRLGLAAACDPDGRIHVIGGTGQDHHVYDIATDTWATAAPLPRDTVHAAVGAWGDRLVVAGGMSSTFSGPSAQVDVYDAATNTWSAGTALPEPMGQAAFARSGSYLYVVGGWGAGSPSANVNRTLRLDMATGAWSTGPAFTSARADAGLVATDRALYAVGGFTPAGSLLATNTVERLDLASWPSGSWAAAGTLPTPLGMAGASCASTGPDAQLASAGGTSFGAGSPTFRDEHWVRLARDESCTADDWGLWQPGAATPQAMGRFGSAQCAGEPDRVYTFGGFGQDAAFPLAPTDAVRRYDQSDDAWASLAPLPGGARDGAAAVCTADGRVHVLGGSGTRHDVYDPATNTWSTAAAVPRAAEASAVGVWEGRIYLVGGLSGWFDGPTTRVDVYDGATDTWSAGPALPEATGGAGFDQSGRYLYLAGGYSPNSPQANVTRTLRLDMEAGTWSDGPTFASGRTDVALVATDRALYAMGGNVPYGNPAQATDQVERLDLATWASGSWGPAEALPTELAFAGGACLPGAGGAVVASVGGLGSLATGHDEVWRAAFPGEACATA